MKNEKTYTTQLQAGLGVIEETKILMSLWEPEMNTNQLYQRALQSGSFPNVSARRLRNLIAECFAPRYLVDNGHPAYIVKSLMPFLTKAELTQLLLLYTCRANLILADFIKEVYWQRYVSGYETISNEDAIDFVLKANQQGKTAKYWSDSTIKRVSSYLSGSCADFGLLEKGSRGGKKILLFRIEPLIAILLAYDLHSNGISDNTIISHDEWKLFGMEKEDVRDLLKKLALTSYFIIQTAGGVIRISWKYKNWEELIDAVAKR